MTKLETATVYSLHPDQLRNLGYDINEMTQDQFYQIAQSLSQALEDNDIRVMLEIVAENANLPIA